MKRRDAFLAPFALAASSSPLAALAQRAAKSFRVGSLSLGSYSTAPRLRESYVQGLRELGYDDTTNIVFERRYAEGYADRLPELAAELVRLKVDVIVAVGGAEILAAKNATRAIPIVMVAGSGDPVGDGIAASLARPGGNVTGMATRSADMVSKRLQLLKEAIPNATRVAALYPATNSTASPSNISARVADTERATRLLRMETSAIHVQGRETMERAFEAARTWHADAVFVHEYTPFFLARASIADLAVKYRLPAIVPAKEYAEAGGLMSYGVDYETLFRRAAAFVDKILRGARPSDLPIEQPDKFELVVNLKTAKALSIKFPQSMLLRADLVIE